MSLQLEYKSNYSIFFEKNEMPIVAIAPCGCVFEIHGI